MIGYRLQPQFDGDMAKRQGSTSSAVNCTDNRMDQKTCKEGVTEAGEQLRVQLIARAKLCIPFAQLDRSHIAPPQYTRISIWRPRARAAASS